MKKTSKVGVLTILIMLLLVGCRKNEVEVQEPQEVFIEEPIEIDEETGLEFPYFVAEEKIEIKSVFPYTGFNPDAKDQECENVYGLELINNTGALVSKIIIEAELSDMTKVRFEGYDIPNEAGIDLFSIENMKYKENKPIVDIQVLELILEEKEAVPKGIVCETQGEVINVQNNTGADIEKIRVRYHSSLGEVLFGGCVYEQEINPFLDGETREIHTTESYFGMVEVAACIIEK